MSTNSAVMPADKIGKGKKEKSNILVTVLLLLGCVMILFPLYMTIVIALKSPSEMTNDVAGALSLPKSFSFSNFREAMKVTNFWSSLTNSIIITGASILISLVIHSMAGYALGRAMNRFKKFKVIYYYIVSGMFVPFAILMMPLVKETATIGIDNMLYSGYLKNVPLAMEEAADIDGASAWRTYWTIIFPMMKPMHATVAILTALGTWNDVMTPLVIMSGSEKTTLPLAQLNFQTQFGTNYNLAFASYLLALIPILIFYILCQKHIIGGVANGAVKG